MTSTERRVTISIDRHLSLARLANMVAFCCLPCQSAYSVGAVIADSDGRVLGVGHSRQSGPCDHAEEAALRAAKMSRNNVSGAYIYTSLEPCGVRNSKSASCAGLLIEAGIARGYFNVSADFNCSRLPASCAFSCPDLITSSVTQTTTCSKRATLPVEGHFSAT